MARDASRHRNTRQSALPAKTHAAAPWASFELHQLRLLIPYHNVCRVSLTARKSTHKPAQNLAERGLLYPSWLLRSQGRMDRMGLYC